MKNNTCLYIDNISFIEEIYSNYQQGNEPISQDWQRFFASSLNDNTFPSSTANNDVNLVSNNKYLLLLAEHILNFFRKNGHKFANLDPLGFFKRAPFNSKEHFNLNNEEITTIINNCNLLKITNPTLSSLIEKAKNIYCQNIGFEFADIVNNEEREWLQYKIEVEDNIIPTSEKERILSHLLETEVFEQFLHIKYPGYKRFSIEGAESAIVSLEKIISMSFDTDITEIVLGMAHRGRLNVLTKVMGKPYTAMFSEFQGKLAYPHDLEVSGDVKYHLGYSCDRKLNDKILHLSLCSNPSHLEAINPVAMGRTRAKQDNSNSNILNILIHGDASFPAQGVVSESLTLSQLSGYRVHGTIHIIINNQIGFTTNPKDARSSNYCSDLAKFISVPVFHVNGDNPESVILATKLAVEYRQKFKKDVVLDIICYRRYGHNEGDEPMFTQPIMYTKIANHKTTFNLYKEKLLSENIVSEDKVKDLYSDFRLQLENSLNNSINYQPQECDWFKNHWKNLYRPAPGDFNDYLIGTKVSEARILELIKLLTFIPSKLTANKKVAKLLKSRFDSVVETNSIDWATGESLAFASLLVDKINVRLSGQDSSRGTFSQRHAKLIDQLTGDSYVPLSNLSAHQGKFEVIDSPISEYAVMGFEYGYSVDSPYTLVLWEGQFGDFANGAQIIIDQFISSAESKWLRCSGLVLLLPHGYEGQGPEHSSARIERYLQLCAEDNMQVVNCTTPANYFHVLRRQIYRNFRKPLIVFTPKSLLRHKMAVSRLSEFTESFIPVIAETEKLNCQEIQKVIICSGKIYYDIIEYREKKHLENIAIIRVEQYYPFPLLQLSAEIQKYQNANDIIWCQEEPLNMGGWFFIHPYLEKILLQINSKGKKVRCISRPPSSSPASGYSTIHLQQQEKILSSI